MKEKATKLMAFFAALFLFCACNDEKLGSVYQIFDDNPASNTLAADSSFTEWVKILQYSDMYNALNQATQPFTLLVPDDEAVKAFYASKGVASIEELGSAYARALIQHHTTLDSITVEKMQLKTELVNLGGDKVTVAIDADRAGQFIFDGTAHTTATAIHAYNALIYPIDAVIIPLVETVYDRLEEDGGFGIMLAAVEATGWNEALSTAYDTVYDEKGSRSINRRAYTLLAVSDDTYAQAGISDFNALIGRLQAGSDYTSKENALYEYVSYHIVNGGYTLAEMEAMQGSDTSRIWGTFAENQVFMVTLDTLAGACYLNLLDENIGETCFSGLTSDRLCKNGYFHEIDGWLPVWEPVATTVIWDMSDNADIRNAVLAEGAEYQPAEPVSTENNTMVYKCGAFEYVLSDAGASNSYMVTYRTCKKQLKECVHNDRLVINMGYMGSVSMKTPTIVRGKYRVDLRFVYLSDHNFMRTLSDGNGGMIRMSFDGENEKSAAPYTEVTKTSMCVWESNLYEEIEFDVTGTHVFSFVILDPAASTNSKFSLQFDSLIFTPIE